MRGLGGTLMSVCTTSEALAYLDKEGQVPSSARSILYSDQAGPRVIDDGDYK